MKTKRRIVALLLMSLGLCVHAFCQIGSSAILTITGTQQNNASGSITITVNGQSQTVTFGPYSTAASIAAGFGAYFSAPPSTVVPPLCATGICAKADGATIVFHFLGSLGTPTESWSATPNSPFQVDASQWPGSSTPLSLTLACNPSPVTTGSTISCTASLPAGTPGSVNFSIDGSNWQSGVPIDSSGNASVGGGLNGASLGSHLIKAQYTASGGTVYSSYQVVEVQGGLNNPVVVYYYSISTQPGSAPPGSGQSGYQANGNVAAYSDSVNGYWNLGYDSLDRLTSSAHGPIGSSFNNYGCWSYDNFGNRTEQSTSSQAIQADCSMSSGASAYAATTMAFGDGTNRITGRGTINQAGSVQTLTTPSYDNVGNVTLDQTYQYLYDSNGHMCAAHTAEGMTGYIYDADGHRVAKGTITSMVCDPTQNGFSVTTLYELGPNGQPMTEVDGGSWSRTDVYAGGTQLATYDGNGVHFQIHDWLGTRRVQTNYAGTVEDACSSNPFGDGQVCTNSAVDVSDRHFTGKERDTESGLDYFGARYYISNDGRWMSPDWSPTPAAVPYATLANPQTLNLYRYVANNPLGGVDVDGHNYYGNDPYQEDTGGQGVRRLGFGYLNGIFESDMVELAAQNAEDEQKEQLATTSTQQATAQQQGLPPLNNKYVLMVTYDSGGSSSQMNDSQRDNPWDVRAVDYSLELMPPPGQSIGGGVDGVPAPADSISEHQSNPKLTNGTDPSPVFKDSIGPHGDHKTFQTSTRYFTVKINGASVGRVWIVDRYGAHQFDRITIDGPNDTTVINGHVGRTD